MCVQVQHALKKSDAALETLNRAIGIDPKNPLCKFHRASILFANDKYKAALQELEELKQIVPKESLVYFLIGKLPVDAQTVRQRLIHDNTLHDSSKLSPDQICQLLELCLSTTYFKYNGNFYRQKHGCATGSPVSPIVANLYMEDVEYRALNSFEGTAPSRGTSFH
uniref:anaphase-promoting complex subunit 3-like n=1 Tax=Epinephelus lanceolatus TaxID=310571 RepID=UPI001447142E|nr:anaphase-promoting complex subunit 3-like [Epinephelus lanceolatus]